MVKRLHHAALIVLLISPLPVLASGPDLVLKRLDGKPENVSDYIGHGKWTVVAIWAHDCPVCNADIDEVAFFHDAHHRSNATVLGVSIDGWAQHKKAQRFVDLHGLGFPNLIAEPNPAKLAKFGGGSFYGTPTFYVYSPTGELKGRHVGAVTQEELEDFINSASATASTEANETHGS
jgi:peroxiredoxin